MSKQSEAKKKQGYVTKIVPMVCSNCVHYESDVANVKSWTGTVYCDERKKRCGIGGFAVAKTGSCNMHDYRQPG